MTVSGAQKYDPVSSGLQAMFQSSFNEGIYDASLSMRQNQATEEQSTTETGSLDLLAPTTITWKQQVLSKLESGLEGEAYNLIMTKLDGHALDYVTEKLSEFMNEFADRGYNDLAKDLGNILQMLSYQSLGLDYDYLATGPNAANADDEMQRHLRHAVDRHFEGEIYKPPQFIQPFLGLR